VPDGRAGDGTGAPGDDTPDEAVVRPFYLTRGRTRGRLALDALVCRSSSRTVGGVLEAEHDRIFELCREPLAVAELAGRLQLPLGVVRVLLDDLVDAGRLDVALDRALVDDDVLDRLIRGVERL
jgi:hypothetical protein